MYRPDDHTSGPPTPLAVEDGTLTTGTEAAPDIPPAGPRFLRTRWPRPTRVRVSLVVPALNEAQNIGWVLERVPRMVDEVILVDGDSTDDTIAVSRSIRPDIRIVGQDRPGKGAALRAGFASAYGDIVVMIDADCSMDPHEVERFVALIDDGYDLVKGSRFMRGGGTEDMERIRRLGNSALNGLVNVLFRAEFTDLCYGYVALRRSRIDALALRSDGFEIETEIVVRALRAGLRIAEVPSFEAPRAHGESNLQTWRDGHRVLKTLLRHRMRDYAEALPAVAAVAEKQRTNPGPTANGGGATSLVSWSRASRSGESLRPTR